MLVLFQNKNKSARSQGLTLIEIVIVTAITGLIVLAVASFAISILRTSRSVNDALTATEEARRTVLNFTDELRSALPSSLGSYQIAETGATNITFYSDIDQDDYIERLRYFVQGTTLKRGVLKPTGSPLQYTEQNEAISIAVNNLINTTNVFSYYDTNYAGSGNPLTIPPDIPSIRFVRISVQINRSATEAPDTYTLTSDVAIRSLKDNL